MIYNELMNYNELQWITMNYNELQWITMNYNELQWITMNYNELQWITMNYNELQWITMNYNELQWITMNYNELQWITMNYIMNYNELIVAGGLWLNANFVCTKTLIQVIDKTKVFYSDLQTDTGTILIVKISSWSWRSRSWSDLDL